MMRAKPAVLTAVVLSLVLTPAAVVRAQIGRIDVEKQARESDGSPAVYIASFDGPAALEKRFKEVLARSNWFRVAPSPTGAEFTLAARCQAAGETAIDMLVTTRSGQSAQLRQTGSPDDGDLIVFRAVDQLIQTIHRNPGLCATKIAFAIGNRGQKEIFTCNFDGTGAEQLTFNRNLSTEPSWGPTADSLVYTAYEQNTTSVVLIDIGQNRQRRLSRFPGLNAGADLSPDGRLTALTLSRDRRIELYVMETRSGKLLRLTNDTATESSPCWSPDGSRICFVSDRAGRPQLYLIGAGGGSATRLLRDADETVSPDWSPVSNMICCSVRTANGYALAVVDMAQNNPSKRLIPTPAGDWESPSWAPDGRHLVCSHRRGDGRRGLVMVDTRSGRVIPMTEPADHSLPS